MTTTDELQLRPFLSGIADAIREVEESEEDINAQEFIERIKALSGGGAEVSIFEYTPTVNEQLVRLKPDIEHGLSDAPNLAVCVNTKKGSSGELPNATNFLWFMLGVNIDGFPPFSFIQGNGGGNSIGTMRGFESVFDVNESRVIVGGTVGGDNKSAVSANIPVMMVFARI